MSLGDTERRCLRQLTPAHDGAAVSSSLGDAPGEGNETADRHANGCIHGMNAQPALRWCYRARDNGFIDRHGSVQVQMLERID